MPNTVVFYVFFFSDHCISVEVEADKDVDDTSAEENLATCIGLMDAEFESPNPTGDRRSECRDPSPTAAKQQGMTFSACL